MLFCCLGLAVFVLSFFPLPVWAHHMAGGELPQTFTEGFLSGLAHPVIGLDHFATIIAIGILGGLSTWGIALPIGFISATVIGSGLHLAGIKLPVLELGIAISLLIFSSLIILKQSTPLLLMALITLLGGVFHGYAYGETIFGARNSALVAYLVGFSLVQGTIASGAFSLTKKLNQAQCQSIGFVLLGIGTTFIFNQVIDVLLPNS
jgi:urease accessory protein